MRSGVHSPLFTAVDSYFRGACHALFMNTDRTGIRDTRPLRRRTSISSPRLAPFSPFTPSLAYRSPVRRPPSPPTFLPFPFSANVQPSSRETLQLRRVRPSHAINPRASTSYRRSRLRKLVMASLGCLILTAVCWHFLALHSRVKEKQSSGSQFSSKLTHNHNATLPYYPRYLIPRAANSDFAFVREGHRNDVLPPPVSHAQLLPSEATYDSASFPSLSLVLPCPQRNLTTVLPRTLHSLRSRLLSVIPPQPIVLVCTPSQSREAIRIAENYKQHEIYIRTTPSERPWQHERRRKYDADISVIHVAASLATEWALILDSEGLMNAPLSVATLLHHPPRSMVVPFGPRGVVLSPSGASCISNPSPGAAPIPVAFLVPPFVCRTRILYEAEAGLDLRPGLSVWAALGLRIALRAVLIDQSGLSSRVGAAVGGFVVGVDHPLHREKWCSPASDDGVPDSFEREQSSSHFADVITNLTPVETNAASPYVYSVLHDAYRGFSAPGTIVVLLSGISDLLAFLPTLCRAARLGHSLHILIYSKQPMQFIDVLDGCHIHYNTLSPGSNYRETLWDWLVQYAVASDVIIGVSRDRIAKMEIELAILNLDELRPPPLSQTVVIWLPPEELPHLEWAGTLSIDEWRRKKKQQPLLAPAECMDRLAHSEGRLGHNRQRSSSFPCSTYSLRAVGSLLRRQHLSNRQHGTNRRSMDSSSSSRIAMEARSTDRSPSSLIGRSTSSRGRIVVSFIK